MSYAPTTVPQPPFHCERHPAFLSVCPGCLQAKRAYWAAKIPSITTQVATSVAPTLAEFLDADPPAVQFEHPPQGLQGTDAELQMQCGRDYIPARHGDPQTSKEAAASVNINERQKRVLEIFKRRHNDVEALHRDLTNEELIDLMGEEQVGNISSRVSELRNRGLLRLNGNKRKSRQGKLNQCHEFVPQSD